MDISFANYIPLRLASIVVESAQYTTAIYSDSGRIRTRARTRTRIRAPSENCLRATTHLFTFLRGITFDTHMHVYKTSHQPKRFLFQIKYKLKINVNASFANARTRQGLQVALGVTFEVH